MGHSQAEKAASRARIVEVAARRFRERGLDGIGLAEVMEEAGMTVGGFYRHFSSRDELVTEALIASFATLDAWEDATDGIGQAVKTYLSEIHRDEIGIGCPLAALVSDVGRSDEATREAYTERVKRTLEYAENLIDLGDAKARRSRAMLQLSACIGALGLSRAVSDLDLSRAILQGVTDELLAVLPEPAIDI